MSKKVVVKVIGRMQSGVEIVSGIFKLVDTFGLPFEIICEALKDNEYMPSWIEYKKDAEKAGWKVKTIRDNMSSAIIENYGDEFWEHVRNKLCLI